MTDRTEGLWHRKRKATIAKILDVSARMFREKGYTETSMGEIAEAVEISRKSLFNYMSSKEDIVVTLVENLVRSRQDQWQEPDELRTHSPADIVAPGLEDRLQTVIENRWLLEMAAKYTGYYNSERREVEGGSTYATIQALNIGARKRRIEKLQAEGVVRTDIPAAEISRYYDALRDLTIQRWLLRPDSRPAELHESFANAMAVLRRGIAALPAEGHEPERPGRRTGRSARARAV